MKTVAVILAAGNSTRMGFPKQLALLDGMPVLAHTLLQFENAPSVDGILLVARPEDFDAFSALCEQHHISKFIGLCPGGHTRQQSAKNSLDALPEDTGFIAVHDGARPLCDPALIERVIAKAKESGAAAAAVPVKDTIKRVNENGRVTETVDRAALRQVQTPQVFRLSSYREALAAAIKDGADLTDDCQLFERTGLPVTLVEGSDRNIKITTPADLAIAAILLKREV